MIPQIVRLYNQMPEPKYVIAMGACTTGGGPYFKWGYHVVKGVDLVVPPVGEDEERVAVGDGPAGDHQPR